MAIPLKTKLSTILNLIREPQIFRFLLSQRHTGFLFEQGWFKSFKLKSPLDKNNNPIPWMTYSFIDFIKERLNKELTVFEFGSGNSTLFFSERVKHVTAVEHNKEWYENIKSRMPKNVSLFLKDPSEEYNKSVVGSFDIVIVDGINRNECIENSIKSLTSSGIIILDDSERPDYLDGANLLKKLGFKRIDFWGISPGLFYKKSTTIFYNNKNCLEI